MNTKQAMSAHFLSASRPPALPARRRPIDASVERSLRSWIRSALQLPATSPIRLCEWVSMDSRAVPHVLCATVGHGAVLRHFTIEKAAERIAEADVRLATGAGSELRHGIYR